MLPNNKFVFKKMTPAATQNSVGPISEYLRMQNEILQALETIIAQEYKALKDRNYSQLQPLAARKSDLMLKLQGNDQKIKMHPEVALLKTKYAADVLIIKNKMKKCKFRNEVNGNLIVMCMQSSYKMQAVFNRARDKVTRNMTYNSKGSASARGPLRVSVSA
jgi:flagellar biosynthesis/type III secretory pathway chaperone